MRNRVNNIFFILGMAAVIVMFFSFDVSFSELWQYIMKAGYWLIAILALWLMLYTLNAEAWRVIICGSGPCTVSFLRLLRLTVTGFALNYTTPCGLLGGEAYRIMELSKNIGVNRATSSVVLFAMMHIFSHFWFWITGVFVYLLLTVVGDMPINVGTLLVLGLATLFCGGGIYLFLKGYKNGMVVGLIRFVSKLSGLKQWGARFAERHREDLEKIDSQIAALHSQNKRSFACSLLLEYVGRILQSFEIFFMLLLFGIDGGGGVSGLALTFVHSFLILAFTSLFANLLGFLPLQIGGREGGFAISVAQLGMTAGTGMFISIICRVRELFWAVAGLALMKIKQ